MIQPKSGSYDKIVVDPPLGLIYASTLTKQSGYDIKLIDTRFDANWKATLSKAIDNDTLLIGLSVMSNRPIHYALEISKFVKQKFDVPVLWGGPHPTLAPNNVLENSNIDYLCRGDGEQPLYNLVKTLDEHGRVKDAPVDKIEGISYTKNGKIFNNPVSKLKKVPNWRSLPFDLLTSYSYHRFNSKENIFPVLTSFGCPYRCSFCYLSASEMHQKWLAYSPEETVELFKFVIDKFNPNHISIIDNDFFVNLKRAKGIFELIVKEELNLQFGLRGTRVDELDRMDEDLLKLMGKAGVKHLHIGAESGSQRILDSYNKGTKIEQIIRVNRKLSKHPKLLPSFNFFGGTPTETIEDLKQSAKLMYTLISENSYCQISSFNQYVPYPGGILSKTAEEYGFVPPKSLEEWAKVDDTEIAKIAEKELPWLNRELKDFLFAMNFISIFIDRKIPDHFTLMNPKHIFYRLVWKLLNPLAKFRLRNLLFKLPVEYFAYRSYHHFLELLNNYQGILMRRSSGKKITYSLKK